LRLSSKLYPKLVVVPPILFISNWKTIYKLVLVQVQPLGESYAVVTLPPNSSSDIQKKIQNQSYVKAALPVLSRADSQDTMGCEKVNYSTVLLKM